MVERINENAYKLDLPGEYGVHTTINVTSLSPFLADDELDLGKNHLQEKGSDEMVITAGHGKSNTHVQVPIGPITRS